MFQKIKEFFALLIGRISWDRPAWLNFLWYRSHLHPRVFWTRVFVLFLLIGACFYTYYSYQHRSRSQEITAKITPPDITPLDKVLIPRPLRIDFGIAPTTNEFSPRPVAPLKLIGQVVPTGIRMTPAMPGSWRWLNDYQLEFTPHHDWPAGQEYTIKFSKDAFTSGVKMGSLSYSFLTPAFSAKIAEFKFYQDPVKPQLREAVATINFTHPVDTASLEKKITLEWQALKNISVQSFKYTLSYDENKRTAYLHSELLPLLEHERFLELKLASGLKPMVGSSATTEALTEKVRIPEAASYFKVTQVGTSIVRNQQDQPEQVLTLETTLGVMAAELNKSLHVYVLPSEYPATALEKAKPNYVWKDPGEVTPAILTLAKPLNEQAIPADRDYAALHSYKYKVATTPAYIYVKIDKGVHSLGNFILAEDYVALLKVPEFPQEISFLHKGSLLALGTEEKLSVLVRGLGAVKFDLARVLPDDINHLITQTAGDFSNPYFLDASFNQENISEIFSQIQPFDNSDPAKAQYTALDFSKYLAAKTNSGGRLGLFLLQARGWDAARKVQLDVNSNRLILITDLGLLVKDNLDLTHDVFVQSITNGTAVSGVTVAILGKNGLPILARQTDAQGHVSFPSLKDFTHEQQPTVYLVRQNNDVSFIPYSRPDRQLNFSRFDVGGINHANENASALTAYLFSDRGIYRPGDLAHIGMIIKQPYALGQPPGVPLEATVIDPRGVTVKDVKMTLNEAGYLTLDFQTNASSQTGQYIINLYIVKDNRASNLIGSTNIHVAEFLPDRMRINAHLSTLQQSGWISPKGLKAKIGLWNLYGAPAANHRITARILLTPHRVTFKEFPDYTFIDPLFNEKLPPKTLTESLPDQQTDALGQAEFDLKLDRFEKATYQLTVFAEGFEAEGGRSVATQTNALVSPLDYLVGDKPDGDLSYIKQNTSRSVHFIAINPQLKQQALPGLTLKLFKIHPITTLVKKEDGTYAYQSIVQNTLVSSHDYAIAAEGNDYVLATQNIGDYLLTLTDKGGNELSKIKYTVVGDSQQPLPKNAELQVKLNKSEFVPGENIEMQITAPYTGAGLITIERDKVYAYRWFKTNTTSSIQQIQLPKDFQGDGYVNIAFVRDLNSPEILMSPLSYSVIPFSVAHENRNIKIDLMTSSLSRPGMPLQISYKTDQPAKIIVFAVDEGILQVAKYPMPDPLKFFFQKHALEVKTQQILDQILPKFIAERELSAVGGDKGEALLYKNLNPFKRRTEAPVVYWSGLIDADTTLRNLTYPVPDYFNGSLRIMAVAAAKDAVGAAQTHAEIRGYFVINPNVPTFVAPGDEFDVTASVANNVEGSGDKAQLTLMLEATQQLEIVGDAKQTLTVSEGQEGQVRFRVRAKTELGSAELNFIALLKDKSSKMTSTLSVRPASAYNTTLISGHSSDENKLIKLDRMLYPEYRKVQVAASLSPLVLVAGMQNYLNDYPYGCVEQLVSKGFPWLAMANQPWFMQDKTAIDEKIQKTIQMLNQRQMSNGGFNYWPDTGTSSGNDFASVYAMHFLTEAKAQGYSVPAEVFSAGIGFLKELSAQKILNLDQARIQAYAIYILTRNEIVTTNYLTHLQLTLEQTPEYKAWRNDIISAYMAATYQMLKSSADAEKMISSYKPLQHVEESTDFINQTTADAQYLYLLARHFPDRLKYLHDDLVMSLVDALNTDTISTIVSGYTSLALAAYGQYYPVPANATLSIHEIFHDGKEKSLSASDEAYQRADVDMDVQQIQFKNPGKKNYFYQLSQAGFDRQLPQEAINNGIEVMREYQDAKNNSISEVKLGDEILVHIRARAIDNQYHTNIALVDLLPGGFEVVRNSIKMDNMDYVDTREDRVIFFGSVNPDSIEVTYHIKATNIGQYTIPPMFAMAMYHPMVRSIGVAGKISVVN